MRSRGLALIDQLQAALAGRYRIEREIGRGGMAVVYLAEDVRHRRKVALKFLDEDLSRGIGAERFSREIETVARLSHPHVLPLHDSGEAAGLLFYVMPYVEGESLRDRLRREGQLSIEQAVRIAKEVALGLDYAHRQGVVHRDIKPENILLHTSGSPGAADSAVVADFGIARAIDTAGDTLTAVGATVGTPAYMSPEQASGDSLDGRSDTYSLGCVLYEMLAGEPPFAGATAQAVIVKRISEPPPRIRSLREHASPVLEEVLLRAMARTPADRFATAADFAHALERVSTGAPQHPASTRAGAARAPTRSRIVIAGAATGLLAVTLAVVLTGRPERVGGVLDDNLLAIAPFHVLDEALALWSEGLVDVLSRNFDGAGSLRTVPPSVVIRRWTGRADAASADELAQHTGAGLALVGSLERLGADSVRAHATIRDVSAGRVIAEVEHRELASGMDRLSDSLTHKLLRDLARNRTVGAVRLTSVRATTLPALKAFLQGEQFFRRGAYDSARTWYETAIAHDSTYALAMRRLGVVWGWLRGGPLDPLAIEYRIRAGAFNHGFGVRDSLIIHAESLHAAAISLSGDTAVALVRRLVNMVESGVRMFPHDPELLDILADSRFHFTAGTTRQTFDEFRRAIELDSLFALPYPHAIQLAMEVGDTVLVRRYERSLGSLSPSRVTAQASALIVRLLDAGDAQPAELDSILSAASPRVLHDASAAWEDLPDASERGIAVARAYDARVRRVTGVPGHARHHLAAALAFRGRLRDALQAGARDSLFLVELALLGGMTRDSAAALFARWVANDSNAARHALLWWAAQRDTVSLAAFVRRERAVPTSGASLAGGFRQHRIGLAEAFLALARGDSTGALTRLRSLPDSLCTTDCNIKRLTEGMLLAARGDPSALDRLEPLTGDVVSPLRVIFALERGRAAERLGKPREAVESYGLVIDAWVRADAELQPAVAEAQRALQRLGADRLRTEGVPTRKP